MTDPQSDVAFEIPENWAQMTEEEQSAWVEAALMRLAES